MTASRAVFISYSHEDTAWRDRIRDHLGALGQIDSWTDERIRSGTDWRKEIRHALETAHAAILIVTRRFLTSHFIQREEVVTLLRRRHEDGLRIYPVIAEPCLWKKFQWLEAMQVVQIAKQDEKQRTDYEIDQMLTKLVGEIDETLAALPAPASDPRAEHPSDSGESADTSPTPSSLLKRRRRIEDLLQQKPGNSIDGLPKGLLKLITDVDDVSVLEEKLTPGTPRTVLVNAITAIRMAADWEWDHKEIKSPDSIAKLIALYRSLEDLSIRREILRTVFVFPPTEIPFDFLVERLDVDPPQLKAEILGSLQFHVKRPYLSGLVQGRLLPLLHRFCRDPQEKCMYSDEMSGEMDFRFWVFRALGGIGSPESTRVIEEFLARTKWPTDMLAEAANAHWDITQDPKYVEILRKAKKEGMAGNTLHALVEIEKYLRSRLSKASPSKRDEPAARRAGGRRSGKEDRTSARRKK